MDLSKCKKVESNFFTNQTIFWFWANWPKTTDFPFSDFHCDDNGIFMTFQWDFEGFNPFEWNSNKFQILLKNEKFFEILLISQFPSKYYYFHFETNWKQSSFFWQSTMSDSNDTRSNKNQREFFNLNTTVLSWQWQNFSKYDKVE